MAVQLSVQCDTKNEQSKDYCKADRNNVYCFVPLVHTLLTALLVILSTLQVKHARVITSHITCNTKNVMCMVQCNRCNLQYIGKTKWRLKYRFNEHRRAVDKTNIKSKPTATVSAHFLSHSNHSHTDMQLIPPEKFHSSRDSVRKVRESHLIDKAFAVTNYCNPYPYYFFFLSFLYCTSFPPLPSKQFLLRHSPSI